MNELAFIQRILATVLLIGALTPAYSRANDLSNQMNACDRAWSSFRHHVIKNNLTAAQQRNEWLSTGSKCVDKLGYQMRIVVLDLANKDFASAYKDVKNIPERSKERRHADLLIRYFEQWAKVKDTKDIDFKYFESAYQELTDDYPYWHVGNESLAQFALYAQDFDVAERAASAAVLVSADDSSYSLLAISSYMLGKYDQVIFAGNRALQINPRLDEDINLMLRLAVSYYLLHRKTEAEGVLSRLVAANPEAKNDAKFKKVAVDIAR